MPAKRSPNIWKWPEVYEAENHAQDATGSLWKAMRAASDWTGRGVVDVGCGAGFHVPRFATDARSVTGVEPHPPLVAAARERLDGLPGVRVVTADAEATTLPDARADLVHARTAYFFGSGCEPGLLEAVRILRPGGTIMIVDVDYARWSYGEWYRSDRPRYRPAAVERYFERLGFTLHRVDTEWRFEDRETLEAVLRIEFKAPTAARAAESISGLTLPVAYRIHVCDDPDALLGHLTRHVWRMAARRVRIRLATRVGLT